MKPFFLFWNQQAKVMTPTPPNTQNERMPPTTFGSNGGSKVFCAAERRRQRGRARFCWHERCVA